MSVAIIIFWKGIAKPQEQIMCNSVHVIFVSGGPK